MKFPKKGKSRKKSKKPKKTQADPNALSEVDRTFYELEIADLNKKLARLRTLSLNLEDNNAELKQNLQSVDEDRADVISYLRRIVLENFAEIEDLQNKLVAVHQEQNDERTKFDERIRQMEGKALKKQEELTADINVLTGKLNALEEFRVQRDELYKRFDEQKAAFDKQEQQHKEELFEADKELIRAKEQLRKEMEKKLSQLSKEFQEIVATKIATSTHRVVQENVALNTAIDSILIENKRLYRDNVVVRERDQTRKLNLDLEQEEKKLLLRNNNTQQKLLERLTIEHEEALTCVTDFAKIMDTVKVQTIQLNQAHTSIVQLENQIRLLRQNLHAAKCECVQYRQDVNNKAQEVEQLSAIMNKTVDVIKTVFEIESTHTKDGAFVISTREQFLSRLLSLLEKSRKQIISKVSEESVEDLYTVGDIGFLEK